jgi:hypothetical protein
VYEAQDAEANVNVKPPKTDSRYSAILDKIFFAHWKKGTAEFQFGRTELEDWAAKLKIELPKNLGDLLYSFRFRAPMPDAIRKTAPKGMEWRIELAGRSQYRFKLGRENRILPNASLVCTKIPDATPELIGSYKLDDEQALLAIIRYNRLIDIFLGLTTYSLQNHLRTTVKGIGQIEIDELYVGLDMRGCHFVIPVQAKGGSDQISVVQTEQDIRACAEKFPGIQCRPVSVQFMAGDVIAMFELTVQDNDIKVVGERHYKLVPKDDLDRDAIRAYRD